MPRHGLINLTFGNASAIDRARAAFAIKPSGVDYTALTPEDMVVIDLEGRKIEGRLNPSSDTPTHRRLFLAFPNIGGVVHTHSSHATAFAQAGRPIPIFGTTHADYFNGEVPVTRKMTPSEIATDYEWETGNVIVETMRNRDPADFPGVLVNRHAPFTWGASVAKALENAVAVECIAQMALMSLQLDARPRADRGGAPQQALQAQARRRAPIMGRSLTFEHGIDGTAFLPAPLMFSVGYDPVQFRAQTSADRLASLVLVRFQMVYERFSERLVPAKCRA